MRILATLLIPALLIAFGCAAPSGKMEADTKGANAQEVEIPVSGIPSAVSSAARQRVPGLVISHAERCTEDGKTVYDLEGVANGVEYELEVSADGTVLEVETEAAEGDEDDACDDDDEDEDGEHAGGDDDDGDDEDEDEEDDD